MEQGIELTAVCEDGASLDAGQVLDDRDPVKVISTDSILKGGRPPTADNNVGNKNTSRRVYFPQDGNIVSGYSDPPNPWQRVTHVSAPELVASYKAACDVVGVKPIVKLLNQLHAIEDFGERYETLTIKGDRLDIKHCETLEEIFKRVQFKNIDLEATHLDDEGAGAVFDMIEYYESTNKLNISFNRNIGTRGWQACSKMLKKTPCLESLDARNCVFTEQSMPFIGRSLRLGSNLSILHLESSNLSGRSLYILVASLKMNELLKDLFLADNKLMPSDGIQLGNLLKFNHRLQLLDLRNNHLQDVGTSHIADGLFEQNLGFGLMTLVLWNNQLSYQSMESMSRALTSNRSLETLNLGHNSITNEGVLALKEGLLKNKSLLRLGLQAAKLSCEGSIALAEYIADTKKLIRMDLRENDIKTAGLMALSLSLKVNETVSRVDLDKEPKRESGVKDYMIQQKKLIVDICNWLQRNKDIAHEKSEPVIVVMETDTQQQAPSVVNERDVEDAVPLGQIIPIVAIVADKFQEDENTCDIVTEKQQLSLLLGYDESPQQTLESPMFVTATDLPPSLPEVTHQEDDLSSSPRTRAKKMFTVAKVVEGNSARDGRSRSRSSGCDKLLEVTANTYVSSLLLEDVRLDIRSDAASLEKFPKDIIVSPVDSPLTELLPSFPIATSSSNNTTQSKYLSPIIGQPAETTVAPPADTTVAPPDDTTGDLATESAVALPADSVRKFPSDICNEKRCNTASNSGHCETSPCFHGNLSSVVTMDTSTSDKTILTGEITNQITNTSNQITNTSNQITNMSLTCSDKINTTNTSSVTMDTTSPITMDTTSSATVNSTTPVTMEIIVDPLKKKKLLHTNNEMIEPGYHSDGYHSHSSRNGVAIELSKVIDGLDKELSDSDRDLVEKDDFMRELDEMLAEVKSDGFNTQINTTSDDQNPSS